jgi:hypothetical protein
VLKIGTQALNYFFRIQGDGDVGEKFGMVQKPRVLGNTKRDELYSFMV